MTGVRLAFVRKELREILRDRRAILLSFGLPVFIYPVMFSFTSFLERQSESKAEEAVHRVLMTGDAPVARAALEAEPALDVVSPDSGEDPRQSVIEGSVQVWVDAQAADEDGLPTLQLVYHHPHEESQEAHEQVRDVLADARKREADRRFGDAGGSGSLADLVRVGELDVATEEETGGARAGRLIPFLLVMTLFIGGGAISTDLVAGEKERRTLETLYLTPVPRHEIAASKFIVVWGATVVTGVLNLLSMLFCYRAGLIQEPGGAEGGLVISGTGVLLAFLMIIPLGALVGGVLLGLSAMARSLREAQMYIAPAMLLAMIPGMLATGQHVPLGPFTALLPIANVALAIRDGLLGGISVPMFGLVMVASIGWGWLATRWTGRILSREDTILGFDPEPFLSKTPDGRRRAALLGMAGSVLAFFYVGNLLQARELSVGLAVSLWVLLPLVAIGTMRLAWSGGRVAELISWRPPTPSMLLGGAFGGAGLVVPIHHGLFAIQEKLMPAPTSLTEGFATGLEDMAPWLLFVLIAVSPGIVEELVFRGAFLGLWRRVGSPRAAILVSSAFFALTHLSVFRFAPTFVIGATAGVIVVRSGSIFPVMVLHTVYNGLSVFSEELPPWATDLLDGSPAGWGLCGAVILAAWFLVRPRTQPARRPGPGAGA